jgi:ADP-heptose:LPS heptosyltransferase
MAFKKILIIRFSSIGDIVVTTPVVRCLKNQMDAEIHYLVKPSFAHVIRENPYIDKIHTLKNKISQTISELSAENFDLIVDLHKNLRSYRVSMALGVKTIRYEKLNFEKWLAVNFKTQSLPKNKHLADRYFDSLKEIGVTDDGEGLDYFILPEDEQDALELTKKFPKYNVLVMGATYYTKRIPIPKCQEIIEASQYHVILIGGKDVQDISKELNDLYPEKVIDFCGKVGLGVSAGITKHAQKVITGDTGMMHIAAALKKETEVFWGSTMPDFGMYPFYGKKHPDRSKNFEVLNLSCRPCSKLGHHSCPKGHYKCMMDIQYK